MNGDLSLMKVANYQFTNFSENKTGANAKWNDAKLEQAAIHHFKANVF